MLRKSLWLPLLLAAGCAAEKANGRPWVHKVEIDGVKHVSKSDLKEKIELEATSWIPLSQKHYLDPFEVDLDKKRVEAYYQAHGYFFAKVTEARVSPRGTDGKSVDVKLVIDEGPPTKIADLEVQGLDVVGDPAQKIMHRLKKAFAKGTTFDHGKYLDEKSAVESHLKTRGYAWATVDGEVDVNRDAKTANVILKVHPGPWATFGQVYIKGDPGRVGPKLIIEHAQVPTGKPFNPDELEAARGRLYNSGVFSSVKVEYEHDKTHPEVANVLISVATGKLHELRLGFGVGFESTRYDFHLVGTYIKHSFLGGLRTLKLRLEPGWVFLINSGYTAPNGTMVTTSGGPSNGPSLKTDVTFTQPDIFTPSLDLKWIVGYDLGIDYAYQYTGPRTTLGLSKPFWHNRLSLGLSYNFNFLVFFNTVPEYQDNPALATRLFGYTNPYRVGWFQEDIAIDLRDKPLEPHKGAYIGTTIEEGGTYAGGSFTYEKIQPELRGYVPLFTKRIIFAARGMFGQIFDQGSEGSPITRRFFMGGPSSHRGFNYDRLSLQVPSGILNSPNLPIGGDQLLLIQGELRFDVVKIAGNWFGFTAFMDSGDVAAPNVDPATKANLQTLIVQDWMQHAPECAGKTPNLPSSVQLNHLHTAVGGGVRYHTPIGTIIADIGVRLNRTTACESDGTPNPDYGSRIAFHISIGEAF